MFLYNILDCEKPQISDLVDQMFNNGFAPLINKPIRILENNAILLDHIQYGAIQIWSKVEQLGMKMREDRLRWYGHVMRRDQEYVGRKMMEMELPGKRRRGRPKKRLLDAVKKDMREVGVKETDVQDRKMWRMMIRCGHP